MNYHLALGADHRGFQLKEDIRQKVHYGDSTILWHDIGTDSQERTDYPIFAHKVVTLLREKKVDYGILICGSGIGASIAANRFTSIYAGLVWNEDVARVAKEDDKVNLLILPADYIRPEIAYLCIEAWLTARFKGGRYQERLDMIEQFGQQKKEGL
jgi:ribose 5-phosphate isomerase B